MKRTVLFTIMAMVFTSAFAQDIVTTDDVDIYMFKPRVVDGGLKKSYGGYSDFSTGIVVQQYVPTDTVTVYGVAITFFVPDRDVRDFTNTGYRALMMERDPGTSDIPLANGFIYRPMHYVDSLRLDTSNRDYIKYCLFRYDFDHPSPWTYLSPCYEFYFNTPMKINHMTDTFYVGRERVLTEDAYMEATFWPYEVSGYYESLPRGWDYSFWQVATPYQDTNCMWPVSSYPHWGFCFPIIGFRCKPLDEQAHPLVVDVGDDSSATVRWYNVEEGAAYNVRLASGDGSVDSTAVTTDTVFTFTHLPYNRSYTVQVRKQCHYATVNYDTTVYSPWTVQEHAFTLGVDTTGSGIDTTGGGGSGGGDTVAGIPMADAAGFVMTPNPARDEVTVSSSFGLGHIEIHDAAGVLVYSEAASGHQKTIGIGSLRSGTYIVTVQTHAGITHKKLAVQRQ